MPPKELIEYECPSISEYISWNWVQVIIGHYVAWKVARKWLRYQHRLDRKEKYPVDKSE